MKGLALRAFLIPLAPRRSRACGLTRETHRHRNASFATLQLSSSICQHEEKTKPIQSHKTHVLRSFINDLLKDFLPACNSTLVPSPCTTPTKILTRKNSLHLKGSYSKKNKQTASDLYKYITEKLEMEAGNKKNKC